MTNEEATSFMDFIMAEMTRLFLAEWITKTAIKTGFIKRERKIYPVHFFWTMIIGPVHCKEKSIVELKRLYEIYSGVTLSDSSWYCRFTPELVAFLRECVIHGLKQLATESCRSLDSQLNCFLDVFIKDNTIIRLHKALADKFPATRSRRVAAGVKLSILISVISNSPKSISIIPERTSDIKTLKIGSWIRDRILLFDLGFYKFSTFSKIRENGGYFVSRVKSNANPLIIGLNPGCKIDNNKITGKKLSEVLKSLNGDTLDVNVEIPHHNNRKKRKKNLIIESFRVVAIYNDELKKYHTYITNISTDILMTEYIANLYRGRWEIELLFKEMKSNYQLDVVETKNQQIAEALIWTSILTTIFSRKLYNIIRKLNPDKQLIRFTLLRWSKVLIGHSHAILHDILCYLDSNDISMTWYEILVRQALDPHVNRDRLQDGLWA